MRRPSPFAFALLLACLGGCASLLGDFDAPSVAAGGDGGGDATAEASSSGAPDGSGDGTGDDGAADGKKPTDGSGDTSPPLGTLTCDTLVLASPFVVADRNGLNPNGFTDLAAFAVSPTVTRVAATMNGATVFTVYSIDSSGAVPTVTSASLATGGGTVLGTMRVAGGFGVIVQSPVGANGSSVSLYVFRDAAPVTPLPAPVALASLSGISRSDLGAAVVELAAGTYYVAIMTKDATASVYGLNVGIATGGVAANFTAAETSSTKDYQLPVAVHVGSTIYLYVSASTGALAFYALPDSGTTAGVVRKPLSGLALGKVFFGGMLDGVGGSATGKTNLAYLEEDANDAGNALGSLSYRAAAVDDNALPTLTSVSSIAFGKTYSDPAVGPFSAAGHFFGDDFAIIAPGLTSGGGSTAWVNFLWLDATGVVRGERSGAVQGLLPGIGTFVRRMVTAPGVRGATAATWNLAWSQYDPAQGNSDKLYFQTLKCHL